MSRRQALTGGLSALGGAVVGFGAARLAAGEPAAAPAASPSSAAGPSVASREPFRGAHPAGVATAPQARTAFLALDAKPGLDRTRLARLLRVVTDDAERLTRGEPTLGDNEPTLAAGPARLTVAVGLGPRLFDRIGLAARRPAGLAELPHFAVDRLEDRWSGGDLLLQIGGDDPLVVTHAVRVLGQELRGQFTTRWLQQGFTNAAAVGGGATPRNLMGQVDGTSNPRPGTAEFDRLVWASGPDWFAGGTCLVLRRIWMDLDAWDAIDPPAKEQAVGRRLSDGAPLTGGTEHDEPDLEATAHGLPVIPSFAHVRRARTGSGHTMFRRPASYDDGLRSDGRPDAGLLFAAYQADIARQFVPVQRRLAQLDLLNTWTVPVGSAVFAMLPGPRAGGWLGDTLLA